MLVIYIMFEIYFCVQIYLRTIEKTSSKQLHTHQRKNEIRFTVWQLQTILAQYYESPKH